MDHPVNKVWSLILTQYKQLLIKHNQNTQIHVEQILDCNFFRIIKKQRYNIVTVGGGIDWGIGEGKGYWGIGHRYIYIYI